MAHRRSVSHVLALLLALMPVMSVGAQATPTTDVPARMTIAVPVDDLPSPAAEVWLLRYIIEPGGSVPQLNQSGPTLIAVEQGEVTLITDGPVTLKNALGSPTPVTATSPAGATNLGESQGALVPSDTRLGMTNNADQQSQVLVLKVFSPDKKRRASIPSGIPTVTPSRVTVQPISNGPVSFSGSSGVLMIERDVVEARQSTVSGIYSGVEVGALEGGEARVIFMDGQNWFRPRILTNYADAAMGGPMPLNPGATINLSANDGFMSMEGSLVWRSISDEPLIIIRGVASSIPS
jgi:hypothetical protein